MFTIFFLPTKIISLHELLSRVFLETGLGIHLAANFRGAHEANNRTDSNWHSKKCGKLMKVLTWDDARPIAGHYFDFWPDGEDFLWVKQCFPSLERMGLTSFFSDEEEVTVRRRILYLALIYAECIERVFHDGPSLSEECFNEIFEDDRDVAHAEMVKICQALVEDIGLVELTEMTLSSMFMGRDELLPAKDFSALLRKTIDSLPGYTRWREDRVFQLLNSCLVAPGDLESLRVMPEHWCE